MAEETTAVVDNIGPSPGPVEPKPARKATESEMFNVSMRAWLALLVTMTVCAMSLRALEVKEPLYSISLLTIGFYFGQAAKPKGQQQ